MRKSTAGLGRLLAMTLCVASMVPLAAHAQTIGAQPGGDRILLPTGAYISPAAIPGSNQQLLVPTVANWPANYAANEAVKSQLSPDGKTLAVVTAGYNDITLTDGSGLKTEFIFIYDVSGANKATPKLTQVVTQNNAFVGLVWGGNTTIYASGGLDDKVYVYTRADADPSSQFAAAGSIALNHKKGIGSGVGGNAAGLALSADGKTLVVANNYSDSITVIDTASLAIVADYDLRPYNTSGQDGVAGGEFPWAIALKANGIAFISSIRDREVVVVDLSTPAAPKFVTRVAVEGTAYGITLSPDQSKLYVAQETTDQVAVIDTVHYTVVRTIDTRAVDRILAEQPGHRNRFSTRDGAPYNGAQTIAVTVSRDGRTLYAVNNANNSISVIPLVGPDAYTVTGLIPTNYAPKDVTFSADGSHFYVINGLSVTGPNSGYRSQAPSVLPNQYQIALEQSSLVAAPVPTGHALEELTELVARNNHYTASEPEHDAEVMDFLREKIKHVIYIVKENRTFDQILGDLDNGANVDPTLNQFPASVTPNFHRFAKQFVTLDNFFDPGDASTDGWSWVMRSGLTVYEELSQELEYSGRPFAEVCCSFNNGIPMDLNPTSERDAATNGGFSKNTASLPGGTNNVMPGPANVGALNAPFGYQRDYIWEAALNAGRTVRSYGFEMVNTIGPTKDSNGNPISDPFTAGAVQAVSTFQSLLDDDRTDTYFRGIDLSYPDVWRATEWLREFNQYVANGQLPSLEMVRLGGDHMGSFSSEVAGVNTPEGEQADNDYAVGKLVDAVAHSRYASDTLIVVVEDDSQDGPDHVDSHRAPAYIVGPYVKKGAVVSSFYSLVNALRTIEDVLGTEHMNLATANARPMADVFDIRGSGRWTYDAVASTVLQSTALSDTLNNLGATYAKGPVVKPPHDVSYWANATRGLDFSDVDRLPPGVFNKILWKGLKGDKPYPVQNAAKATPVKTTRNARDEK